MVSKGKKCSVNGCEEHAERSLSYVEAKVLEKEGLKLSPHLGRVYLCGKHYKLYKKIRKKEKRLEKWRFRG
ncbi:MAG: hypothetical protein DRN04_15735 [Thermoprotei archaeon]|nr:MAG: hypothetical protein DRN04_15735 [Thermoprotei archaeon]